MVWGVKKTKKASVHILALYDLSDKFLIKNGDIWLDGNAIELVIQNEYCASGFAFNLRNSHLILKVLNYLALVWEFLIPVFILWLFKRNLKMIAAIMIVLLHLGLLMIAQVGPFWMIGMAFSAALLPQEFWKRFKFKNTTTIFESLTGKVNSRLKTLAFLFFIAIMFKGNLRYWYIGNYVSPLMRAIPGSETIFIRGLFLLVFYMILMISLGCSFK